jgi:hypothetical protein
MSKIGMAAADFGVAAFEGFPLPDNYLQARDEVIALRNILRNERKMLANKVEQCEKYRRELSKMASTKDKEIAKLKTALAQALQNHNTTPAPETP